MGTLDGASADIKRRGEPAINVKRLGSYCGAHDVDYRVYGADFVKVDSFYADVVDLGFGFAEGLEHCKSAFFGASRNLGAADDGADLFQATMRVCVGVRVVVPMLVFVDAFGRIVLVFGVGDDGCFVSAGVGGVVMRVRMSVLMRVVVGMDGAVSVRVLVRMHVSVLVGVQFGRGIG